MPLTDNAGQMYEHRRLSEKNFCPKIHKKADCQFTDFDSDFTEVFSRDRVLKATNSPNSETCGLESNNVT